MIKLYLYRGDQKYDHFLYNNKYCKYEVAKKAVKSLSDAFDLDVDVDDLWTLRKLTDDEVIMIKLSYPDTLKIIYEIDDD